jgi:hypothetical protein
MTEMQQNEQTDYEAVYISENFGVPFTTALRIAREKAEKNPKPKAKRIKKS